MSKLQIEIDLDKFGPLDQLDIAIWHPELEYWIEFLYADPERFLDGTTYTLIRGRRGDE